MLVDGRLIYDLGKLQRMLPRSQGDFAKAIRRWQDGQSISADLKLAEDALERAMRLHLAGSDETDLEKMALIHSAVMGYGRATEVETKHRGTMAMRGQFTPEQLAMHKRIIELRHEAIGHFGPAGIQKPWNEDRVLLVQEGMHWQPICTSRRSLFDREFVAGFLLHLQSIDHIIAAEVEKRRVKFQAMLLERSTLDEVATLMRECILTADDIEEFRGPVLGGPRTGRHIAKT